MNRNILVINEDEDVLYIIKVMLERNGYTVISSLNLICLNHVDVANPGLIIMSDWFDGRAGTEHCKQFKLNTETSFIPVILTSMEKGLEKRYKLCHADAFINFPFEMETILEHVRLFV